MKNITVALLTVGLFAGVCCSAQQMPGRDTKKDMKKFQTGAPSKKYHKPPARHDAIRERAMQKNRKPMIYPTGIVQKKPTSTQLKQGQFPAFKPAQAPKMAQKAKIMAKPQPAPAPIAPALDTTSYSAYTKVAPTPDITAEPIMPDTTATTPDTTATTPTPGSQEDMIARMRAGTLFEPTENAEMFKKLKEVKRLKELKRRKSQEQDSEMSGESSDTSGESSDTSGESSDF